MYKVATLNNIADTGTAALGPNLELTPNFEEANAVLVRSASMHDMDFPASLMAIARAGAGVNNIPLERCADEGIVVFNSPGANAGAVKEMVLCGMLLAARDIVGGIQWVRANADDPDIAKDAEAAKAQFAGTELFGKKMGVVGLGAVGTMVANICRRMGMTVYGYDPYLSIRAAWNLDHHVHHVTDLGEIFSECDYISLHVPANDSTKGMIGAEQIAAMKNGVVLINYARDLLVDEEALAAACESGHVARYVTDFANPVSAKIPDAIVTPHLAASTQEAEDNCAVMAAAELRDYLENGNINNSVNFGTVDLGPLSTPMRVACFHKNIPNMIGQITSAVSAAGINIENMANRGSGDNAYTLLELGSEASQETIDALSQIDGIYRVRVIQAA